MLYPQGSNDSKTDKILLKDQLFINHVTENQLNALSEKEFEELLRSIPTNLNIFRSNFLQLILFLSSDRSSKKGETWNLPFNCSFINRTINILNIVDVVVIDLQKTSIVAREFLDKLSNILQCEKKY